MLPVGRTAVALLLAAAPAAAGQSQDPPAPRTAVTVTVEGTVPAPGVVSLNADAMDFRAVAGTTADLVRYAQMLAGASGRRPAIYVDGLPANALPALDLIQELNIDGDPFSVELGEGDVVTIEIVTRSPARALRVFSGADLPVAGGADALTAGRGEHSRSVNLGAMGGIPGTPLTFSAAGGLLHTAQDAPLVVSVPELAPAQNAAAITTRHGSASLGTYFAPGPSLRVRTSVRTTRAAAGNVGVGGVTREEAGSASSTTSRELRSTVMRSWTGGRYDGGGAFSVRRADTTANSDAAGVTIGGDVVMGGDALRRSERRSTRWTSKHVVRSTSGRRWLFGAIVSGETEAQQRDANPSGTWYFSDVEAYRASLSGAPTGTWLVDRGTGRAAVTVYSASPFAQTEITRSTRVSVTAGLRVDVRSDVGAVLEPRVSALARWGGAAFRAGAGLFARDLPAPILLSVRERAPGFSERFIAAHASLADPQPAVLASRSTVGSALADDLTRPRAMVWQVSAEREIAGATAAIEFSVTDERHLLGSDRYPAASGWFDRLESNRRALRQQLHLHAARAWRGQRLMADYDFTRARDNADGAFSFPEQRGEPGREWARSAGRAPHEITVMAALSLPGAVSLTISEAWHGSAPFNVTTGLDTRGDGVAVDRGGRPRNTGDGPRYHAASLYVHRRFAFADLVGGSSPRGLGVSLQIDNLLNTVNYLSTGSVAGSSTFGRPLGALAGRSLRVSLNIE